MNIAYIVLAHRYPDQLIRLIHRLNNSTGASFFVHIDKKTKDEVYHYVVNQLQEIPNVYFLDRCVCHWGGYGHVEATLKGIEAIRKTTKPYDYVILLTGQDYPIKTNEQIKRALEEGGDKSFLDYSSLPIKSWPNGGIDRFERWHFHIGDRYFVFPEKYQFKHPLLKPLLDSVWSFLVRAFPVKRRFPQSFNPFGGSAYWCLSRECVEYIHSFVNQNRAFVKFFKHVHAPEEIFFQTIVMNSPLKDKVINDDLRYIDWSKPNPPYPAILKTDDFFHFSNSSNLFARKFDIAVDRNVLDMIDQDVLHKATNT
jgi:hypothetical protein